MTLEQLRGVLLVERHRKHLTQREVAKKMGMDVSNLCNYERKLKTMTFETCQRYAEAMGISLGIIAYDDKTGEMIE